jgi:hypothetical protein
VKKAFGLAALWCLLATPALCDSPMRGNWQVSLSTDPNYLGMVLIDAEGRAIWQPWRGYVSKFDGADAQITLTNGKAVSHVRCRILSSDLLDCNAHAAAGTSASFMLKRVAENVPKLWQGAR